MENDTPEIAQPTKEDLEKQKLLLEIAELQRVFWKKPAYMAAVFPSILALTALIYGFANGYFQASFVKLENQKFVLQKEIDEFTQQKIALQQENNDLQSQNQSLSSKNDKLVNKIEKVDKQILEVALGLTETDCSPPEVRRSLAGILMELGAHSQ